MKNKKPMLLLFLAVFIDLIGFGIIIPVLPFVAENFGANGFVLGIFVASFSLMQFIFAPFWGMLSDKVGRRPVMLIGILGTAISFIIFGLSTSLLMLFISRILNGAFTAASLPTAQAYIADITEPKDRAKAFGYLGVAFGLGFAFGPALGGLLSGNGILFPALVAGSLSTLNFIGALIWLPETHKPTGKLQKRKFLDGRKLRKALHHPSIGSLILTFTVVSFAFSGMETTYALFGQQRAGLDAANIGIIFSMVGFIMVVAQGFLVGLLVRKIGERKTLLMGLALGVLAYLSISMSSSYASLVAATVILALGFGLTFPSVSALISLNTSRDGQGEIIGITQGMGSLARVVGPIVAGFLFVNVGIQWPYYMSALVGFIALLIAVKMVKGAPTPEGQDSPGE